MSDKVKMIDISGKEEIYREATAIGRIKLKKETVEKIMRGEIEKGNVFSVAKTAAILAVKKTPEIIALCHPIPINSVKVDIYPVEDGVEVKVTVIAISKTGVEMEALSGVSVALLNIWDMVKKYEKDELGQYPETVIYGIRVLEKIKRGSINE